MKAVVVGRPQFEIELTDEQLHALTLCAKHHYSAECKAAAEPGGFIFGWNNRRTLGWSPENRTYHAKWHELDIASKCLEGARWEHDERDQKEGRELGRLLNLLFSRTNDVSKHWHDAFDITLPIHL
jgi:hypothetical protein